MGKYDFIMRILCDCFMVVIALIVFYMIVYICHRHNLAKWISKATFAANNMFDTNDQLIEKKKWVLRFIYDNGLNQGLSDDVVENMVDDAFRAEFLDRSEKDFQKLFKTM